MTSDNYASNNEILAINNRNNKKKYSKIYQRNFPTHLSFIRI